MDLFGLIKNAGAKIFDSFSDKEKREQAVEKHITDLGIEGAEGVSVQISEKGEATVSGENITAEQKDKILVAVGNISGVTAVIDKLTPATEATESAEKANFYTVQSGDSLSGIAAKVYGNANGYMKIFEANKPMLSHPDKIYPGQVLIIPEN
ncbi:peptidoglycan-binding protein LysM [Enterobacteriaceae bacterium H18W14]|uniref:peptidoglycan-binding protein LysM n=1 Tax=Dryocola boscaweniae TaxID=2925397 RepID=UPI0022F08742|nr:peptidoglycan-binding protein LysM [Dryocola boscaweniae]MCT4717003.1 peptidoglycan-binding protein LysM [Dryocola boscaweniae]